MIKLEIQYFQGCPGATELLNRLREVVNQSGDSIELTEVLVEDQETARRVGFRGSPTLLLNGVDFEGRPEPLLPNLCCRLYPEGLPTVADLTTRIEQA